MRNILFITGCYPKEYESFLVENSKVMPQNAANVLSWRIIEGFEENIPDNFKVLTCPFIGYFPKQFKKVLIPDAKWEHKKGYSDDMLGFINLKGFETLQKSVRIYKYVKKWYKESPKNRNILIYSHYAGFMRAAGKIKKKMSDMHITCLVTDMNEFDERKDLQGLRGKIKGIPRAIMIRTTYKNLPQVSSFVLLAERMKEYLGVGDRPYTIVEGIAKRPGHDEHIPEEKFKKEDDEFRVVYTGTLHERYGVVNLARAFNHIKDKKITLYICGAGDGEKQLNELALENPNIHFLGVLSHEKALDLQKTGDLLVNSMPNFGIHTALSFPSKTMEYMLVGKPVLCYKVEGIPNEYDDYLMYFKGESEESIAESVLTISKMDKAVLASWGARNRTFITENKNPKVMVKKILHMLNL